MKKSKFLVSLFFGVVVTFSSSAQDKTFEDKNKEIVKSFVHNMKNRNNPAVFPDLVNLAEYKHAFYFKGHDIPAGPAGAAKTGEIWYKGFDEMNVEIKFLQAHGNMVVEYSEVKAHHSGEFCGFEPLKAKGKNVTFSEVHVYTFDANSKIIKHEPYTTFDDLFDQLSGD